MNKSIENSPNYDVEMTDRQGKNQNIKVRYDSDLKRVAIVKLGEPTVVGPHKIKINGIEISFDSESLGLWVKRDTSAKGIVRLPEFCNEDKPAFYGPKPLRIFSIFEILFMDTAYASVLPYSSSPREEIVCNAELKNVWKLDLSKLQSKGNIPQNP